jgi:hypothetical protein
MLKRSGGGTRGEIHFKRLRQRVESLCEGLSRTYPDLSDQDIRAMAHRVIALIHYPYGWEEKAHERTGTAYLISGGFAVCGFDHARLAYGGAFAKHYG